MNIKKFGYIGLVATVLSGCETKSPELVIDAKRGAANIQLLDSQYPTVSKITKSISNADFEYVMGDKYTRKFRQKNPNATLNDLYDFSRAECWNGYLKPKIENCESLTAEEAVLLDFCMNVELNMIDTLSVAALGDMTTQNYLHEFVVDMKDKAQRSTKEIEGIYKDEADVFVRLKANFLVDGSGIRVPMKSWAEGYKTVPPETLKKLFNELQDPEKRSDSSSGSHPWIWGCAYTSAAIFGGAIGVSIVGGIHALTPDSLNEIESSLSRYAVKGNDHKNRWQAAHNRVAKYVPEVVAMRGTLDRAKSQMNDAKSSKFIQNILDETEEDRITTSEYLDYAFYDLPFIVQTYKARAKLKDCKGFFNDDEKAMMGVMSEYNAAVSGTAMLRNIRTPYAANAYAELVKYFKSELSDREFQDFIHETRLYRVDLGVDSRGMPNNKLSEIGK